MAMSDTMAHPVAKLGSQGWRWLQQSRRLQLSFMDQALVSGVNFLSGILLARFLGIEEFGRFNLIWMLVLLCNACQQSIILQPMMSMGAKQEEGQSGEYFGTILIQQGVLSLLWSILVLGLGAIIHAYFPGWRLDGLTGPVIAVIVSFQMQELMRRYYFSKQRIKDAFINDLISYGGQLAILGLLFFTASLKTTGALWVIAGSSTLAALIGFVQMEPLRWNFSFFKEITIKHWHFAKWLLAASCIQWISGQFFVMVSVALFNTTAAGAIAAARNILGPTLILFTATDNIVSVQASLHLKQEGWSGLRRYMKKVNAYGGLLTGFICLIAAIFAPVWLKVLFGDSYAQYGYLVYWMAATHFLMFFVRILSAFLRTVEVTRPFTLSSILPLAFSLLASEPLIKLWGLSGSVIVMFGNQLLILLYLAFAALHWSKEKNPSNPVD